jgi:hypothetical protein
VHVLPRALNRPTGFAADCPLPRRPPSLPAAARFTLPSEVAKAIPTGSTCNNTVLSACIADFSVESGCCTSACQLALSKVRAPAVAGQAQAQRCQLGFHCICTGELG